MRTWSLLSVYWGLSTIDLDQHAVDHGHEVIVRKSIDVLEEQIQREQLDMQARQGAGSVKDADANPRIGRPRLDDAVLEMPKCGLASRIEMKSILFTSDAIILQCSAWRYHLFTHLGTSPEATHETW